MSQGPVGVFPTEVVVIARSGCTIGIQKGRMREVETIVEHSSYDTTAGEGLWQAFAGIYLSGVDLLGCDIHGWPWHAFGLNALDAGVGSHVG